MRRLLLHKGESVFTGNFVYFDSTQKKKKSHLEMEWKKFFENKSY